MKPPPFGETTKERSGFFEKVKIELLKYENKFGS